MTDRLETGRSPAHRSILEESAAIPLRRTWAGSSLRWPRTSGRSGAIVARFPAGRGAHVVLGSGAGAAVVRVRSSRRLVRSESLGTLSRVLDAHQRPALEAAVVTPLELGVECRPISVPRRVRGALFSLLVAGRRLLLQHGRPGHPWDYLSPSLLYTSFFHVHEFCLAIYLPQL